MPSVSSANEIIAVYKLDSYQLWHDIVCMVICQLVGCSICQQRRLVAKMLTWFQTFDNSLDAGVDSGFFKRSSNVWWNRTRWLYRNSTDGFAYYVLGIPFIPSDWAVQRYEGEAGVFKAKSTRGYFNYRGSRWNFAVKLGWKAWNMYDENTGAGETIPWGPEWRIPYVCSVSFNWRRVFGKEK